MSDDLKKVGLVFKADGAVDFIKTNQSVNATLRENYQQFKLTQTQWNESTKTSEKLASKLNYLNNAFDIQEDKVRVLRTELKELETSEKASTVEIDKKKASLKQAEAELGRYGNQIQNVEKKIEAGTADLEDFAKKLDKQGNALESAGKKMSIFSAAYTAATGLATKAAIDFESSIAGVAKTFPGTEKELKEVTKEIRNMAQEIPATTSEISEVTELAGQLGIKSKDIMTFTRTMIDLGEATNLSAEAGAEMLAKFANVTKMDQSYFTNLGSSIVALGNNFATTEADIASMAMNLGSAGTQVGMTQADILALATALSSVGLEAQGGGTAFSKIMIEMQLAAETGSEKLQEFANVAGMSANEFATAFKEDATGALLSFIDGLSKTGEQGTSAIKVLDDMGITETRLRDALLRSANASDIFSEAIGLSSEAWEENTALTEEAETRYATTESQLKILGNTINDLAISFGELLLPHIQKIAENLKEFVQWLNTMDPAIKNTILIIGGIVAAIGPLLIIIGKMATGVSAVIKIFTQLAPLFGIIKGAIISFAGFLSLPVAAVVAIGVAIAALVYLVIKYWDQIKEFTINLFTSIGQEFNKFGSWINGIVENVKECFTSIFQIIGDTINAVIESVIALIQGWLISISEMIQNVVNTILTILQVPIDFIKNAILLVIALFAMFLEAIYKTIIEPLVAYFIEGFTNIKDFIDSTLLWISDLFNVVFEFIHTNIIKPFSDGFNNVIENIKNFISTAIDNIKSVFKVGFDWIKNTIITPLTSFFSNIFNSIWGTVSNVINSIKNAFSSVGNFIKDIFNGVRDFISNLFEAVGNIIKAPINGVISLINGVLRSLNNIKIPSWVPGLGGVGINFPMINYLATGGNLLEGAAIVGEAGPEMLFNSNGRSTVVPLTQSGGSNKSEIIDYTKLGNAVAMAMMGVKFTIDEDGLGKFVDDRLLEVVPT